MNNQEKYSSNPFFKLDEQVRTRIAKNTREVFDKAIEHERVQSESFIKGLTYMSEQGWALSLMGFEIDPMTNELVPLRDDGFYLKAHNKVD
jgi:hypothetical protein